MTPSTSRRAHRHPNDPRHLRISRIAISSTRRPRSADYRVIEAECATVAIERAACEQGDGLSVGALPEAKLALGYALTEILNGRSPRMHYGALRALIIWSASSRAGIPGKSRRRGLTPLGAKRKSGVTVR